MAGMNVQVCRRTKFFAPAISTGGNENVLMQLIDTLGWRSGVLQLRVYDNGLTGSGASATVNVYNSLVSDDDPAAVFTDEANPLATATIDGNVADGMLLNVALSSSVPIGRYVSVTLRFAATGSAIGGEVIIGVDLVGRDV